MVVAVLIGGTSGFFGGKLDLLVQRFVDAWMAFPGFGDAVRDLLDPRLKGGTGSYGVAA